MKAQKVVIAASTGIAFLLCLAGFVFAFRAYSEASKIKATLGGTFRQLEQIYNENPFPYPTNVTVLRNDTAWTTNWYQSLVGELHAAAVPNETLSSSGFIQKLQDTSSELQKKAAAEGGKVLVDGFSFGFDRYLGSSSHMPKPENVKQLAIQFMMVEAITREILNSHVVALSRIERENFEGDAVETPASTGRRRTQPAGSPAAPAVGVADSHYPGQHFTFGFTADEKALAEVLGRLAKMPMFVVVTELKIDRVDRGLRPRPEKPAIEADKTKTAVLQPSHRVVSGPEIPPLLKIQMQVDVYTFEGV